MVKCNVPLRGWMNGIGGCPNVGGVCTACTSPGFPDRFMPFVEPDRLGTIAAGATRFVYGPLLKHLRRRGMRTRYDVEPEWRRRTDRLETGYERCW
jgi:hydrogenase small subunit